VLLGIAYIYVPAAAIVAVPSSNCYAFDSDRHLVDFVSLQSHYSTSDALFETKSGSFVSFSPKLLLDIHGRDGFWV
jgi:hypothetical protein